MPAIPAFAPARLLARAAVVAAAAAAAVATVSPASAHVEVEASPARQLAAPATLTFVAEAESTTVGTSRLEVKLPAGLTAADLRLTAGPSRWQLSPTAAGFAVGGPAAPVGRDVTVVLRVRQLPRTDRLLLPTLQTYADGRVDRWVEVAAAGAAEPEFPAPVVALAAPAPGADPLPPAGGTASPSAAATTPRATSGALPTASAADDRGDGGPSAGLIAGLVAAVVVGAAVAAGWLARRRRRAVPSRTDSGAGSAP